MCIRICIYILHGLSRCSAQGGESALQMALCHEPQAYGSTRTCDGTPPSDRCASCAGGTLRVSRCVLWGWPVAIRRVETDGAERLHAYSDVPREGGLGEGLEVLLDSPQLSQLQSRILAHPNLFRLHGAKPTVFHANKHFDAHTFGARVANELAPWIRVARLRTRGLRFTKFRRSSTLFLLSQPKSFFSKTVF
jgi:hypothetical protein